MAPPENPVEQVPEDNLSRFKRKRGHIKGQITSQTKLLEDSQADPNGDLLEIRLDAVTKSLGNLEPYTDKLMELDPKNCDQYEKKDSKSRKNITQFSRQLVN